MARQPYAKYQGKFTPIKQIWVNTATTGAIPPPPIISIAITAYGIGAGGWSGNDTTGGASGAGAVVKQFTITSANQVTTLTVGQPAYARAGGASTLTNSAIGTITAYGGNPMVAHLLHLVQHLMWPAVLLWAEI